MVAYTHTNFITGGLVEISQLMKTDILSADQIVSSFTFTAVSFLFQTHALF